MTLSSSDDDFSGIKPALEQHKDWFACMPWVTSLQPSGKSAQIAIQAWIDEYGEEFQETSAPLSSSVNMETCCHRILNLLSGPCRAFVQQAASTSAIYQKIKGILQQASGVSGAESSFDAVRDAFRPFGRNDGVRHCVLASAVEAGHERAIMVFRDDFDGVRRQLASSFSERLGEDGVNEIWQDVFTDLVFGEGASS